MNLLMPEETVLRDTSTRLDFYVFAPLRFDIVKNGMCIFPSFWFYKRYYFCH